MGLNVLLMLVDVKTYRERLLPAHRAFADRGNVEPIRELLRDAASKAPDVESPFDLIDLNRNPEYVRKKKEAQQAQEPGDPAPMREPRGLAAELAPRQTTPRLLTCRDVLEAIDVLGCEGADASTHARVILRVLPGLMEIL